MDSTLDRWTPTEMARIWRPATHLHHIWRIWAAVLDQQHQAGLAVPPEVLGAYRAIAGRGPDLADLAEAERIERDTRHQTKAQLQAFNAKVGGSMRLVRAVNPLQPQRPDTDPPAEPIPDPEYAHIGLTSCDVQDLATQIQIAQATALLVDHATEAAHLLAGMARQYRDSWTVGRTHGQPAQPTTLGKRICDWYAELGIHIQNLDDLRIVYPIRGIQGAIGTNLDLTRLYSQLGIEDAVDQAEQASTILEDVLPDDGAAILAEGLLPSSGQTYPRSLDAALAAAAVRVCDPAVTIATNLRLMAAQGHCWETPADGQVGSSAMPHKNNPRYSERICGLANVVRGYQHMLELASGGQWYEGDVTSSAVRRVALPGLFCTVDSVLANLVYVLRRVQFDLDAMRTEAEMWLPFMVSGRVMAAAMAANPGVGREQLHAEIRQLTGQAARPILAGRPHHAQLWGRYLASSVLRLDPVWLDRMKDLANHGGNIWQTIDALPESGDGPGWDPGELI